MPAGLVFQLGSRLHGVGTRLLCLSAALRIRPVTLNPAAADKLKTEQQGNKTIIKSENHNEVSKP